MVDFDLLFESVEDKMNVEEAKRELASYWEVLKGIALKDLLKEEVIDRLKGRFPDYLHETLLSLSPEELERLTIDNEKAEATRPKRRRRSSLHIDYAKLAEHLIEYLASQVEDRIPTSEAKAYLAELLGERKISPTQWKHIVEQFPYEKDNYYYELIFYGRGRGQVVGLKRKEKSTGDVGPMVRNKE